MAANGSTGARLYIVGSIREDTAENRDFVRALRERAGYSAIPLDSVADAWQRQAKGRAGAKLVVVP